MYRILITGAFGFIGTNISKALSENNKNKISALDLFYSENSSFTEFYNWSELDEVDWNGFDVIIHLAGIAHDISNRHNLKNYFDINVGLTKKVYDYFLKGSSVKFIYFSSVKAVADSINDGVLFEDTHPSPTTNYGKSKLEAERYILDQPITKGKNIYILRPCMVHGPGNKGNLNLLYKFIKAGIPYPFGAFENKRSYVSIDNLVFILEQLIERNIPGGIYNIADDDPLSTLEIVKMMFSVLNRKIRILKVNKGIITNLATIGDRINLPFNNTTLIKLTENYVVSNQKLLKALNCSLPVKSKDGIFKTLSYL